MTVVALATAATLPLPDTETAIVARLLADRGLDAPIEPWDGPFDWSRADVVVVRSTWDYVRRLDEFLRWIDHVGAAIVNPRDVLRWNAHKRYLAELGAAGLPVVPTAMVHVGAQVTTIGGVLVDAIGFDRATAARIGPHDEIVVKPAVSASAYGTMRGHRDDPALTEHLRGLVATGDALVQPLVPSVIADGEVSLIYLGGELSHAVRKVAKAGDYRVQHEHGGTVRPHTATRAEVEVAEAALAAVPAPCAYARVDVVAGPDGPLLMELELIEPELFLGMAPGSAERFATVLADIAATVGR